MPNDPPRRGPPLGNRNALKHGRRTAEAIKNRKLRVARMKACAIAGGAIGMFVGKIRRRPIRHDQLELLQMHEPLLARFLAAAPSDGVSTSGP